MAGWLEKKVKAQRAKRKGEITGNKVFLLGFSETMGVGSRDTNSL